MIFIVDDDEAVLAFVSDVLTQAGYGVTHFQRAADLLAALESSWPELILSDVLMPETGGFALRGEVERRFPALRAPFVFLSSLSDPEDVVRGLDRGGDDYLTKPIEAAVLVARVRAHLRRARSAPAAVYRGELARYPFGKLLRFCELKRFTGTIEIRSSGESTRFRLEGGRLGPNAATAHGDEIARCLSLTEGAFVLLAEPADLSEVLAREGAARPVPQSASELPTGYLSGVRYGDRLFQVQTELLTQPSRQVVTVVMLEGKSVLKRAVPAPPGLDRVALEKLISERHALAEQEVREKLDSLSARSQPSSPKAHFDQLFEEGLTRFLERDWAAAAKAWEKAKQIDPSNKLLEVNLSVAHRKLGAA